MEHFLSTGQAAEYLEITVDTLNSRIRAGNFPKPDALIGNRYQGWRQTTIERVRQLQRNQVRHLDIDTTQLVKSINTIRQVAEQTRAAAILATKHLATTGGIDPAAELLLTAARLKTCYAPPSARIGSGQHCRAASWASHQNMSPNYRSNR